MANNPEKNYNAKVDLISKGYVVEEYIVATCRFAREHNLPTEPILKAIDPGLREIYKAKLDEIRGGLLGEIDYARGLAAKLNLETNDLEEAISQGVAKSKKN